jgi:hypothetical protein
LRNIPVLEYLWKVGVPTLPSMGQNMLTWNIIGYIRN